jgi:RNA polymerase sigma factor (sigma-70 family)
VDRNTDQQLLQAYAQSRCETAFAELVRRHIDFVYSAAKRLVGAPDAAQDVAQEVFLVLARHASSLGGRLILIGWLHRTTRNIAMNVNRTDARRRAREQEAAALSEWNGPESGTLWEQVAPHVDMAVSELSESEREAFLLRYFQGKPAREVGEALGISPEAAQKRAIRALERVRAQFVQRGIPSGIAGLAVAMSTNAVQSAPTGLAVAVCSKALAGAVLHGGAGIVGTKLLVMTTKKILIGGTLAIGLGTGIYEGYQSSALRNRLSRLEAFKAEQEARFNAERADLETRIAALTAEQEGTQANRAELARLRGEVSRLRAAGSAAAKVSSEPNQAGSPGNPQVAEAELPTSSWGDVGFSTPEAALRTRGWCVLNGNRERFRESVFITPDVRKTLEDLFVRMAEASTDPNKEQFIEQVITNKFGVEEGLLMPLMAESRNLEVTGYRIVSQTAPSNDERILTVETTWAAGPTKREHLKFRRFESDWKVVIDRDTLESAGL